MLDLLDLCQFGEQDLVFTWLLVLSVTYHRPRQC